jgi:uncharacterized protein
MVTGTGKVQVAPDEAVVHLTIVTDGRTAAEAVAQNARQTQAVINAVSALPNHGVTTSGLSVFPITSFDPNTGVSTIVGFRATNSVNVTTKPEYVGQIYDAGLAAGANQSSGITFRLRDEVPVREEALRLAVDAAFREANVVAAAAGLEVGDIESLQVEPGDGIIFFRSETFDARAAATPVIPEPLQITARVNVQFRARERADMTQGKVGDRQGVRASGRASGTA